MIKFISEDALLEIKNNRSLLYSNVITSKKQTLEEAFHDDRIIRDTSVPADEFQLDMSAEKQELTDFENVKRVHKFTRICGICQNLKLRMNASGRRIPSPFFWITCGIGGIRNQR